ncbi:MAG: SUMF1/EgtB/PvdO family nonheme iron enzyme [Pseudomonadota bacterium]
MATTLRTALNASAAVVVGLTLAFDAGADSVLNWVKIPGSCFELGDARGYAEERPARKACVEDFELTRTEVTNAQFARFVSETGYVTRAERGWVTQEPGGPGETIPAGSAVFEAPASVRPEQLNWWHFEEGASWRKPSGPDGPDAAPGLPVVHVTRADAEAFARWAGGRLPTEIEWESAAQSAGDDAADANTWQGLFPIADTGRDGFKGIAPVASFEANALGLHDMIGNVWELTATPYAPDHSDDARRIAGARGFDPAQPTDAVVVIKGGSYLCARDFCYRFRAAARQAQNLYTGTSHVGFRIARARAASTADSR